MEREIVIERYPWEKRVAIMEDGRLVEVWWDDRQEKVGNIYKGRIEDVVPGLSCAFVNIGAGRNAFLYIADVNLPGIEPDLNISDMLRAGQELLLQVRKEAFQDKGARVTTNLTLPGRYLVLLPFKEEVSISRKIEDNKLRSFLKTVISERKPDGVGVIVRTAAATASFSDVEKEFYELYDLWKSIYVRSKQVSAPALLYEDLGVAERVVRDYLDGVPTTIVVNEEDTRQEIINMMGREKPTGVTVKLETGDIFGRRNLDKVIKRALKRRVWLDSGGFLIVDETEAMTVIDVNSGKFTGKNDFEATVLKINLEAAEEIPRQLRLRSIGGIILVDFIDMKNEDSKRQVLEVLKRELDKDKAHTRVMGITRLGFLEMTRKKSRFGIRDYLTRSCEHCEGTGRIMQEQAILNELKRKLSGLKYLRAEAINCEVSVELARAIASDAFWQQMQADLNKEVRLNVNKDLQPLEYRLSY